MPLPFSTSQINKLGDRLRKSDAPDEKDLRQLQELRAAYDIPLRKVADTVRDLLGVDATTRIKTVNTIIDKLKRDKMRLSVMRDVAGLRVVRDMTWDEQDACAQRVLETFAGAKLIDRRKDPRHGYTAVHVEVEEAGFPIEIQIRTRLQDAWAQTLEKLSDHWGRGVRYGLDPDEPAEGAGPDRATRKRVVDRVRGYAEIVMQVESLRTRVAKTELSGKDAALRAEVAALETDVQSMLAQFLNEIPR